MATMFVAPYVLAAPDPVTMKLLPSGASRLQGYYMPQAATFGAKATAKPPKNSASTQYGTIELAGRKFAFALSEPEGLGATLVVDSNGDGDLSNDAPAKWESAKSGTFTMWSGSARIDLGKSEPVAIEMYRFDPKDPDAVEEKNSLFWYPDFGYEVGFTLDGKPFTASIAGEPDAATRLRVDRNGDGEVSTRYETATIGRPFNFTGTTYVFGTKDGALTLETAKEKLALAALPPDLRVGKRALPIAMTALDGKPVDLMKDYKGKLVLLDFWATWCGPCVAELPNVKAAYAKYKGQGFDVLGVSFDEENFGDKLKAFTKENAMPWRQVYEGKGWKTKVGTEYDVSGIPFVLLVDGDTGEIIATETQLRGPGLRDFIAQKLAEKKAKG